MKVDVEKLKLNNVDGNVGSWGPGGAQTNRFFFYFVGGALYQFYITFAQFGKLSTSSFFINFSKPHTVKNMAFVNKNRFTHSACILSNGIQNRWANKHSSIGNSSAILEKKYTMDFTTM